MKSNLLALAGATMLAIGFNIVPANATVAPESRPSAEAAVPAQNDAVRLVHSTHHYCGWGPRRGWWHRHGWRGPVRCNPRRFYGPGWGGYWYYGPGGHYPRCFYDRWGRWVCRY